MTALARDTDSPPLRGKSLLDAIMTSRSLRRAALEQMTAIDSALSSLGVGGYDTAKLANSVYVLTAEQITAELDRLAPGWRGADGAA